MTNPEETLCKNIAKLLSDFEAETGQVVQGLSLDSIEVTTSESRCPEFIRKVNVSVLAKQREIIY